MFRYRNGIYNYRIKRVINVIKNSTKILNFGSLNYDHVYSVEHIVNPGETISSSSLNIFCGGKGLNQSVALARAGISVYHAGLVGEDADMLFSVCDENGINRDYIKQCNGTTGNAIIQVDSDGQNSIVLFGGTNQMNTKEFVLKVLSHFREGDFLILQNEVNLLDFMISEAYKKGMIIALNPSPFNEKVQKCNLNMVSIFLMNEIEGAQITGEHDTDSILSEMLRRYPHARVVLTLGEHGAVYCDMNEKHRIGIYNEKVVDTTAAGDTFTGYFLASILTGERIEEALKKASIASALAVSKKGAIASIPLKKDVLLYNGHLLK